jgi:hypothetical protein
MRNAHRIPFGKAKTTTSLNGYLKKALEKYKKKANRRKREQKKRDPPEYAMNL